MDNNMMMRQVFSVAMLIAWAPVALAFPPCPLAPLEMSPMGGSAGHSVQNISVDPWHKSTYLLVGQASVIAQIDDAPDGDIPASGACRADSINVVNNHTSAGIINLKPAHASPGGFGTIVLPEMPAVAFDGLQVPYTLGFKIDNAPLAMIEGWVDVLQMDFLYSDATTSAKPSSVYRLRKRQPTAGPAVLELIESRVDPNGKGSDDLALADRVVATIALQGSAGSTAIALRWTQHATMPTAYVSDRLRVDSILEILGPTGTTSISLPNEWVSTFSMGLLDYNIEKLNEVPIETAVHFTEMTLSTAVY
jgi:hypothetical protein